MNIKNFPQYTRMFILIISTMILTSFMFDQNINATETLPTSDLKIEFNSGGTLVIKDGGIYEATGGAPAAGLLGTTTSVVANGNLEIILDTQAEVTILDIQVSDGNLALNGAGSLVAYNSLSDAVRVSGNLTVNSKLECNGDKNGVKVDGEIIVSNNGSLIGTARLDYTGVSTYGIHAKSSITCNNSTIKGTGRSSGIASDLGDITANGSGWIESAASSVYPIRAEKGDITANGGTIRGISAVVDGVTTGTYKPDQVSFCTITATNNGKIIGQGDNAGVGGGLLIADNGTIEGNSKRIGASGDESIISKNGGIIKGTIIDADPSQNYGVICWDGSVIVNADSTIIGIGELGVVSYSQSIEADGGNIVGNGKVYGVYAANSVTAKNNGDIKGTSTNEETYVKGIYAKVDVKADSGYVEGRAKFYGVVANGSILAENNSTIKGIATVRIDDGSSVLSPSITAINNSTIFEYYYGDVVSVNYQTPINPYFNSKNMTDFSNYTWSADSGAVAAKPTGLIATQSSNLCTIQALRDYAKGVNEVVVLSGTGDKHIIQLPGKLAAAPTNSTGGGESSPPTESGQPTQSTDISSETITDTEISNVTIPKDNNPFTDDSIGKVIFILVGCTSIFCIVYSEKCNKEK